jgi:UDP-N-acetylmuramoylalanine--D-glutamate ligase
MEWVRELKGVEYINDSKATTAESCLWALDHIQKPIVMICGGKDKNIDFGVVNNRLKDKVKKVYVFGEAKEKIAQTFEQTVKVEICDFLQHALTKAKATAEQGDCVLFSPMCASFDMFSNFEERGRTFKELVNELE